jgi:ornithine carbamoyltransferase
VLNALSSFWHPTQVLADLLTLHEHAHLFSPGTPVPSPIKPLPPLRPLTIAYVGDSANVLHDMLVTYPRLGHNVRVATPPQPQYNPPKPVWDRVVELGCDKHIVWSNDPREAVKGADVVVTDTWCVTLSPPVHMVFYTSYVTGFQWAKKLRRHSD